MLNALATRSIVSRLQNSGLCIQRVSNMRSRLSCFERWCCVVTVLSLLVNAFLLRQAMAYRSTLMLNRLDPIGLSLYPSAIVKSGFSDQQRKALVLFGDSRVARWPTPFALLNWDFINRGAEAQTTAQAQLRFDYHVSNLHPDVVLIQVGINDLRTIPLLPSQERSVIENCEYNISTIVDRASAGGATVIVTTIFPLGDVSIWNHIFGSSRVPRAIDEVNHFIRALSTKGVIVFDADALLSEFGSTRYLYEDELHLNSRGYKVLNDHLVRILATLP